FQIIMSETITGTSFLSEPAAAGMTGERGPHAGLIEASAVETRADYWHRQLSSAPVLNLPADKSRPATPATRFAWRSWQLERNLAERLRRFSQDEQIPFSIVFLSAFQL